MWHIPLKRGGFRHSLIRLPEGQELVVEQKQGGPPLPEWCLFPATAVLALLMIYVIMRSRSRAERYLLFACWIRYVLSAFHQYTYQEVAAGLSLIALGSIGIVGLGALILDKRRFFIWPFAPVALICVLMLVSGFLNHDPKSAIEPVLRYAFFVVIAVAFAQAVELGGPGVVTRLLWVFVTPITFQMLSIGLGVVKAGELDGSVSYIGGYFHEQLFSLILATCFVVTCFATQIRRWLKALLSVVSLVGIVLANYRTTVVGMTPLVFVQIFWGIPASVKPSQRGFVRSLLMVVAGCCAVVLAVAARDRFADLFTALSHGTGLIKPPQTFSLDDRHLLSARPYIWSNYIYAYDAGTPLEKFIGFGPDSWTQIFPIYAHNTIVSYLYELGVVGVAAILLLWATMASVAFRVEGQARMKVLTAHASFIVLSMATMPQWQIEGNILYGIICGYTLASARAARARAAPRRAAARRFTNGLAPPRRGNLPAPAR